MATINRKNILSIIVLLGLLFGLVQPVTAAAPSGVKQAQVDLARESKLSAKPAQAAVSLDQEAILAKIEPALLKQFNTDAHADYFIWLTEKADLSQATRLQSKAEKGQYVLEMLQGTADRTQKEMRSILDTQGVIYESFYISNKILVRGGSQNLMYSMAARLDVAQITSNHKYQLEQPKVSPRVVDGTQAVESNISFVNADKVWALGITGEGSVLAGNDTGLDWQHPAIINHYRGWDGLIADHNYNWWDATGTYPLAPVDGMGHGTHTTGTMVGDDGGVNQIGMAPGAKTIHCKNMDDGGGGFDDTFIECFQWDLAPWDLNRQNPRPDLAPDAVNNSWGYWNGNYPVFADEIVALQAAGILVEVSAGNEGPGCATLRSPGDYSEVLTTGSVGHFSGILPGSLTDFSSRGPSLLSSDYLPDIMAPGQSIRSSLPGGGYEAWDGTSMAGPHTTGLIGLIWSANPGLRGQIFETQQIIFATAVPLTGQIGSSCGGDYTLGPNNDWGHGTIDALAAVQAAMNFGGTGTLAGTVSDAVTSQVLEGAVIRASLNPTMTWQMVSDTTGFYSRLVFSGTYTVTSDLYGYYPALDSGVQVISGTTTIHDISMQPAPFYTVSGRVSDANTGWPLYAKVDIDGYPGDPVWTDPKTGQYSIDLAAGVVYTFNITAWVDGYKTESRIVGPLGGAESDDIALKPDLVMCAAPGYTPQFSYFEDFEASDGGYTLDGNTSSWQWGIPTSGPRSPHSGNNVWATNLAGDYFNNEWGTITSPEIDLSLALEKIEGGGGGSGPFVMVTWWQWLETEENTDFTIVEVSNDGGFNWVPIYNASGNADTRWGKQTAYLDNSYAVNNFRIRFTFYSDGSVTFPGWYVDDIGIGITAPLPTLYAENFEASDGLYVPSGINSWEWGTPTRGPNGAYSGVNAWGTNLDGNYHNREDGYLVSPLIDLSAFRQAVAGGGGGGEPQLMLTWWQWLQTESGFDFASVEISDGTTWTQVYDASGIITTDWQPISIFLDPQYALPNFQVRFHLQSDKIVTYPGFYVDDVQVQIFTGEQPTVPCTLQSGGLVMGNVYDTNTAAGLSGATLTSTSSKAVSQPTPVDPLLEDGFYILFAPVGPQVITASLKGGYGIDQQTPAVPLNDAVWQDFHLPAGWLAAEPSSLEASLGIGAVTTVTFSLDNLGQLAANYELREKGGEFTPARLGSVTVPGYKPSELGTDGKSYAGNQLKARPSGTYQPSRDGLYGSSGARVLLVMASQATEIQAMLQAFPDLSTVDSIDASVVIPTLEQLLGYDCVIVGSNFAFVDPIALGDILADYVDAGGTVVQTTPTFYDPDRQGWGLQGRFIEEGYSPFIGTGDWFMWADLGDYDTSHPIMQGVTSAGDYFRQMVDLTPGSEWVASWTDDEFIATKDSVVALNTFLPDGYLWTGDIALILHNSVIWLQTSGDVPWLITEPITGTVAAADNQLIQVTLDASVPEIAQPGQYTAEIRIMADTPYEALNVPVVMNVTAPEGWGKLSGTINGLGACDTPGAALAGALVSVGNLATLATGDDGAYAYWMAEGVYPVTVSADGFISQKVDVTVTAAQTSVLDFNLRRDTPCEALLPQSFDLTIKKGEVSVQLLTMNNSGAGNLAFIIFETPINLVQGKEGSQSNSPRGIFNLVQQKGPTSLLTLSGGSLGGYSFTPQSGWFGGLDLPIGIQRYAHAQCLEQPDSYYVISGVDASFQITDKSWRYDALPNTWTELATIPTAVEAPSAVCYQGKIYVMGGGGTNQFYIYDVATNSWISGAALPRNVEGAAAAAWDGKVYLIGGDDDFTPFTGVSDEVNVYDIASDTWEANRLPMPVGTGNAGYVQTGPYVYVVGGWGEQAPSANLTTTLRYDMTKDTWEVGPEFTSGRADFALAATAQALYALGGDENGGGFFESSNMAERLDITDWPNGTWSGLDDPLPVTVSANNAGFCTQWIFEKTASRIWSVGGFDSSTYAATGRTLFREPTAERCYSIYQDVSWLSVSPQVGDLTGDTQASVMVTVDTTKLDPGVYTATLAIWSNDPTHPLVYIPVKVTIEIDSYAVLLPLVMK